MLLSFPPISAAMDKVADVGGTVTLPCQVGNVTMSQATVYWQKRLENKVLCYWKNGKMDPNYQNEEYRNRSRISHSEFQKGNLSLIISNLRLNDSGEYDCIIRTKNQATPERYTITLKVNNPTTVEPITVETNGATLQNQTDPPASNRHHYCLIPLAIFLLLCVCAILAVWVGVERIDGAMQRKP
ncbi:programmed cell death 1 ligand 1-like [Hemiscyllium ocellatum]|uniref:programmed cell death 1 ligand 1-like n=1 Tax=Hemiscyllium ocellatum TaxID=170820 RepID=UPI002966A0C4|nr:programmed cell death 1 ligand 1-like [Hemiscyllium ocellatum]